MGMRHAPPADGAGNSQQASTPSAYYRQGARLRVPSAVLAVIARRRSPIIAPSTTHASLARGVHPPAQCPTPGPRCCSACSVGSTMSIEMGDPGSTTMHSAVCGAIGVALMQTQARPSITHYSFDVDRCDDAEVSALRLLNTRSYYAVRDLLHSPSLSLSA